MRILTIAATASLALLALAGCLNDDPADGGNGTPAFDGMGETTFRSAGGSDVRIEWAPGALSTITNEGPNDITFNPPPKWLFVDESTFQLAADDYTVAVGESLTFLPPPAVDSLAFAVDGESIPLPDVGLNFHDQLVSGENVWDLEDYQRQNFPHREPGHPDGNYGKAILYFQEFFEDLGMEVEVDPYGTQGATDTAGCFPVGLNSFCPESFANVVATLPGTDPSAPTIFVAGGHFDMVPNTVEAAFDDTSGTVSTMELARVMSQFEWRHTLKFGLWGGEENGILGSQFWIQTNPDAKATVTSYWNLDVVGMSWPAPIVDPDPHVIAAGPDIPADNSGGAAGPVAEELLRFAQELQAEWFQFPTTYDGNRMFIYEGVASGQVAGYAGVNAQSDHTPFMAAGIPSYFIFNGDTLAADNPVGIHNPGDTLDNMTKYAYFGGEETAALMDIERESGIAYQWDPEELEEAKQILAQSWEAVLWFPFYSTVLQDVGYWTAPGVAGTTDDATSQLPLP